MKTPNSIYLDPTMQGGIPVTSGDIIRIFCDVLRTVKVKRSIIKLDIESKTRYYVLSNDNMILDYNGTAVLVRATTLDLTKVYVFDVNTDRFLGIVNEKFEIYGDKKSMSRKDELAIMRHGNQIKTLEAGLERRYTESMAIPDPEESFELKVFQSPEKKDVKSVV